MKYVIVSRHLAAVEFIRSVAPEFANAPVVASATSADVRDAIVAGNLPLHLASLAAEVVAVEFAGDPPRGQEYNLAEMTDARPYLHRYQVLSLDPWGLGGKVKIPEEIKLVVYDSTGTPYLRICSAFQDFLAGMPLAPWPEGSYGILSAGKGACIRTLGLVYGPEDVKLALSVKSPAGA